MAKELRVPGTEPGEGNSALQIGRERRLAGGCAAAANRKAGLPPPLATWPRRSKIAAPGTSGAGRAEGAPRCACPASDGGFQRVSRYARVPRYVPAQEAEAASPTQGSNPVFPAGARAPGCGRRRPKAGGKGRWLVEAFSGLPPPVRPRSPRPGNRNPGPSRVCSKFSAILPHTRCTDRLSHTPIPKLVPLRSLLSAPRTQATANTARLCSLQVCYQLDPLGRF